MSYLYRLASASDGSGDTVVRAGNTRRVCGTRRAAGEVDTSLPLCWCVCVLVCVVSEVSVTCAEPRPTYVYPHGGAGQIVGGWRTRPGKPWRRPRVWRPVASNCTNVPIMTTRNVLLGFVSWLLLVRRVVLDHIRCELIAKWVSGETPGGIFT